MIANFDTNFQKVEGKIIMKHPTFFSCGCGSVTARLSSVLQFVPLSSRQLYQAKPKSMRMAKEYLQQEHLADYIPLLKQHVYGVLIDNKLTDGKHAWADINGGAATTVAANFRRILNVPEPHK